LCIPTYQLPDTKSNPNPNPIILNSTQYSEHSHARVLRILIHTRHVVAPSALLKVVIVTVPNHP